MEEAYLGPHKASFNKLRYQVPVLMRQTLIDLAVRCGLDFREGWQIPLTIRFVDMAPGGVEHVLAYVMMMDTSIGPQQSLCINLAEYERHGFNFEKVFAHELTHAMLNDSLGIESRKIPRWFHEGLAVYGANQGEKMLAIYVSRYSHVSSSFFINGLEGSRTALDYAEDYLAFKYIHDVHGINSLRLLVQQVIRRKGDIPGAIEATCFENWEKFQENARKFAEEEISRLDRAPMTHIESQEQPY